MNNMKNIGLSEGRVCMNCFSQNWLTMSPRFISVFWKNPILVIHFLLTQKRLDDFVVFKPRFITHLYIRSTSIENNSTRLQTQLLCKTVFFWCVNVNTNETFKVKTNKNKTCDVCKVEGESQ